MPVNVLCLCPNHHVLFDKGAFYLTEELEVIETTSGASLGQTRIHKDHQLDLAQVAYPRDHCA